MLLVEQIKKEIIKVSKKKKYHHKTNNGLEDFMYAFEKKDDTYISSYINKGRTIGYVKSKNLYDTQRIVKPYKFGPQKYKLELILKSDFAICIDDKSVMVFSDTCYSLMDDNTPIYKDYTIDKETFFNLSLEYDSVLNADEIEELRVVMRKHCKNLAVHIYKTNVIASGLVPWKW